MIELRVNDETANAPVCNAKCRTPMRLAGVAGDLAVFECGNDEKYEECPKRATRQVTHVNKIEMTTQYFCPCLGMAEHIEKKTALQSRLVFQEMQQISIGRDHEQRYIYQCTCPRQMQVMHKVLLQTTYDRERHSDPIVTPQLRSIKEDKGNEQK